MRTIKAFLWGTAIGALVGLLFAPQRGETTRNQLQERLNSWQVQAQSQFGSLKSRTNQLIDQGRKTTSSMFGQANMASDAEISSVQDAVASKGPLTE